MRVLHPRDLPRFKRCRRRACAALLAVVDGPWTGQVLLATCGSWLASQAAVTGGPILAAEGSVENKVTLCVA